MAISMFDTRTMLAALEQMKPPKTFLLDTFFSKRENSTTKYVDIDITKGKRRLAAFVRPQMQAKKVERIGYTAKAFEPPYIKMKMETTAELFLKRQAGNTIYQGNSSPAKRASEQLGKDLVTLREMIIRREEWMAAKVLETGKITVVGEGFDAEIDFGLPGNHQVSPTVDWDGATATPIADLRTWKRKCVQDSGLVPDVCVMAADVIDAFIDQAKVQAILDNRRINVGMIDPQGLPSGAIYWGDVEGLSIYSYDEWYLDGGTEYPMVPEKKLFLGSTKARTARHYAAIQDLEFDGMVSVDYFPKSWIEKDPSVRWLMIQSAPVVCMHQPDAFLVAEVLP